MNVDIFIIMIAERAFGPFPVGRAFGTPKRNGFRENPISNAVFTYTCKLI